jgi:quinol monooxygenase YgiN
MKKSAGDVIILAEARAKPGKEAELAEALREAAGPTRQQPGCVAFSLCQRHDSPATIMGFERWASEADHQRHLGGAHIARLMQRMGDILAENPRIVAYTVLDD